MYRQYMDFCELILMHGVGLGSGERPVIKGDGCLDTILQ